MIGPATAVQIDEESHTGGGRRRAVWVYYPKAGPGGRWQIEERPKRTETVEQQMFRERLSR